MTIEEILSKLPLKSLRLKIDGVTAKRESFGYDRVWLSTAENSMPPEMVEQAQKALDIASTPTNATSHEFQPIFHYANDKCLTAAEVESLYGDMESKPEKLVAMPSISRVYYRLPDGQTVSQETVDAMDEALSALYECRELVGMVEVQKAIASLEKVMGRKPKPMLIGDEAPIDQATIIEEKR